MKYLKIFLFLSFFILLILISAVIWDNLNLPLKNDLNIVGFYSIKNKSYLNDIFGYILFISIPTFFFILWIIFVEKIQINKILNELKYKKNKKNLLNIEFIFLYIVLGFLFLEFLSIDFPENRIDYFHEGQRLSAAFNNKINHNLWSGSYITVGLFYEIIGPKIIWKFFGNETIGALRFLDIILILITKIILVILSFIIARFSHFEIFFKNLFFFILCFIFTDLINYDPTLRNSIEYRDIPILLTLILFFCLINKWNKNNIYLFFVGILFSYSYLWSIDRALVQNILTILFLIFLLINSRYKEILIIIGTSIFCFILIYFQLENEFNYFVNNTITVFKEANLLNGLVHPIPFGAGILKLDFLEINSEIINNTRATKTILLILISIILSIYILIFSKKINYNIKIILFSLSLVSVLSYIYALGRTDYSHLKQVIGYPVMFYLVFFYHIIVNFFLTDKLKFAQNRNKLFLLFFIFIFFSNKLNFNNILTYKIRLENYTNLNDNYFIDQIDKKFVQYAIQKFKNEKCITLMSNDVALLYLIKKPSCTQFYFAYTIGSSKNQNKMIKNLFNNKYIIFGGKTDKSIELHEWALPLKNKYPILIDYINQNYELYDILGSRKIYKRIN